MSHELAVVDPLMVAVVRTIAEDCKMSYARDWNVGLGIGQTEALWGKITNSNVKEKGLTGRNKYVLFTTLS